MIIVLVILFTAQITKQYAIKMKENTLLEMKNRLEMLGNITQGLISELRNLKDLSVGTLETVKLLPGYKEAIEELIAKNTKDGEENTTGGLDLD